MLTELGEGAYEYQIKKISLKPLGFQLKLFGIAAEDGGLTKENLLKNEQTTPMELVGRRMWLERNRNIR